MTSAKNEERTIEISKSRFDDHLSRKFFHMLSGTLVVYFYLEIFTRTQSIYWIVSATLLGTLLEVARISWPALNRQLVRLYGPLMRAEEAKAPSAQLFYILGLMWAIIALPKIIAVQAILTLAWMDPIAGIVGVRYGKRTWNKVFSNFIPEERRIPASLGAKTVEGSFAGFLTAVFAGAVAWIGPWAKVLSVDGSWTNPDFKTIAVCSLGGALVATIAEAWPSQWDDNAKIPFWTGSLLFLLVLLWGIPVGF